MKRYPYILLIGLTVVSTGCSTFYERENSVRVLSAVQETGSYDEGKELPPDALVVELGENTVGTPPKEPEGVVAYCWEEPVVDLEQNGPGLASDQRFYHPAYIAVRQIRAGKWRPCRPAKSEVRGGMQ